MPGLLRLSGQSPPKEASGCDPAGNAEAFRTWPVYKMSASRSEISMTPEQPAANQRGREHGNWKAKWKSANMGGHAMNGHEVLSGKIYTTKLPKGLQ